MATQDNMPQKSPFAKLFSSASQDAKQLQKIRDRIYYFAWSRERRDEAKLDWVVSENGVNRNVHLRWIDESSSGLKRNHIDGLPCWLPLVNKQISADFIRFVYSVNDLDVLVDLKADHTNSNEDKLDKVANLLQNANFQRYTRSARVRIHFPDKYPFQNLPVFNQYALENIAMALDGFQQLAHLSVRVVPMQGPGTYELRLAAFPFYPMSMTNWSVRVLNDKTYNWDLVGGEQLHHLNLAWESFQETGSLTATVQAPEDAERPNTHIDQAPEAKVVVGVPKKLAVGQKKNGSQKRKDRKLKTLTAVTAPSASKTASEAPSKGASLCSSSPVMDHSLDYRSISVSSHNSGSGVQPFQTKLPILVVPTPATPESPDPVPADQKATDTARPFSPPASSIKPGNTSRVKKETASEIDNEALETDSAAAHDPRPAEASNTAPEQRLDLEHPRETSPSSSAPSSVTLGRDESEDGDAVPNSVGETPQVETTLRGAGADSDKPDSDKPVQKKKRNRKKGRKTQSIDTEAVPSNDDSGQNIPITSEDNGGPIFITTFDAQGVISKDKNCDGFVLISQRTFVLADVVELARWGEEGRVLQYKTANGRWGLTPRSSDLDRLLRQKERIAAQATERQAEKTRVKGKRKTKKAKEVMIRRKGPSDVLRRRVENTRQLAGEKQGSDLRKRFNEITGERQEKEAFVSHESSEASNSSDEERSSQEGDWPSQENAEYLHRHLSTHYEHLDTDSVSHGRRIPGSSAAAGFRAPLPTQVFMFSKDDNAVENGLRVEHQDVEELEHAGIGYDDEPASSDSHDHHQRGMTGAAGHSENRSNRGSSETAAANFVSAYQFYHHDHKMDIHKVDEQRLVEELEDSDDGGSVISNYGDEGPPSISDDESQNS